MYSTMNASFYKRLLYSLRTEPGLGQAGVRPLCSCLRSLATGMCLIKAGLRPLRPLRPLQQTVTLSRSVGLGKDAEPFCSTIMAPVVVVLALHQRSCLVKYTCWQCSMQPKQTAIGPSRQNAVYDPYYVIAFHTHRQPVSLNCSLAPENRISSRGSHFGDDRVIQSCRCPGRVHTGRPVLCSPQTGAPVFHCKLDSWLFMQDEVPTSRCQLTSVDICSGLCGPGWHAAACWLPSACWS